MVGGLEATWTNNALLGEVTPRVSCGKFRASTIKSARDRIGSLHCGGGAQGLMALCLIAIATPSRQPARRRLKNHGAGRPPSDRRRWGGYRGGPDRAPS